MLLSRTVGCGSEAVSPLLLPLVSSFSAAWPPRTRSAVCASTGRSSLTSCATRRASRRVASEAGPEPGRRAPRGARRRRIQARARSPDGSGCRHDWSIVARDWGASCKRTSGETSGRRTCCAWSRSSRMVVTRVRLGHGEDCPICAGRPRAMAGGPRGARHDAERRGGRGPGGRGLRAAASRRVWSWRSRWTARRCTASRTSRRWSRVPACGAHSLAGRALFRRAHALLSSGDARMPAPSDPALKTAPSQEERVVCEHADRCGGCPIIGLPYAEQLALKRGRVVQSVSRYAALELVYTEPVRPATPLVSYRTRREAHRGTRGQGRALRQRRGAPDRRYPALPRPGAGAGACGGRAAHAHPPPAEEAGRVLGSHDPLRARRPARGRPARAA